MQVCTADVQRAAPELRHFPKIPADLPLSQLTYNQTRLPAVEDPRFNDYE
jgi:hypothetical protein